MKGSKELYYPGAPHGLTATIRIKSTPTCWHSSSRDGMGLPAIARIVAADGEAPLFAKGDRVRILLRAPTGHYRVPHYVRGKLGTIESVIEPVAIDNEQEGFGRNAGDKRHYYRVAIPLDDLWPHYVPVAKDDLCIEIFETWLERV